MVGWADYVIAFDATRFLGVENLRILYCILLGVLNVLGVQVLNVIGVRFCPVMCWLLRCPRLWIWVLLLRNRCDSVQIWSRRCDDALVAAYMPFCDDAWSKMSRDASCVDVVAWSMGEALLTFLGIVATSDSEQSRILQLSRIIIIDNLGLVILLIVERLLLLAQLANSILLLLRVDLLLQFALPIINKGIADHNLHVVVH